MLEKLFSINFGDGFINSHNLFLWWVKIDVGHRWNLNR